MQDRFKCKVWSVEQKKMYSWSDCIKMGSNFIYGMFLDHRMLGKGIWLVRQCTGLKDKNGKLIYEGDLLQDNKGQIGKVFWNSSTGSFAVNWLMKDGSYETDNCFGYGEIIGNIYENPELLEVK